ncbi:hypothetical protein D3C71_1795890 [compost metagenome]
MSLGINTLLITSGSTLPGIALSMASSCKIIALRSFKSDSTMPLRRCVLGSLKPAIFISPGPALSSLSSLVLNLKLGARTCSINREQVIALSMLLTAIFTKSSLASG